MSLYSVDIEADGPAPGLYSMLSIGVVVVRPGLEDRFYRELQPISERWSAEAIAVSGLDRERLAADGAAPATAMAELREFVGRTSVGRPVFISDNPGFDFGFANYYFHAFGDGSDTPNPFGHSARRIGDLWAGLMSDGEQTSAWKELRETGHTHNALDDAVGNAEALLAFADRGLRINFD